MGIAICPSCEKISSIDDWHETTNTTSGFRVRTSIYDIYDANHTNVHASFVCPRCGCLADLYKRHISINSKNKKNKSLIIEY
ncbi:MAG: hypothetical protein ACOCRK_06450 [bacterium]